MSATERTETGGFAAEQDDLLTETVSVASVCVGSRLRVVGKPFPGSRRTLVVRLAGHDGGSYVVKRYLTKEGREAYAREAAALSALSSLSDEPPLAGARVGAHARVPLLVAECDDPRLVVMRDAGEGTHLADALLGSDAERAASTLAAWADAVAGLHRSGSVVHDAFAAGVRARSPEPVVLDYLPRHLADAAVEWTRLASALEVDVPTGTFDVLASVPDRFRVDASSLSAADMCPDNNLVADSGLVLLDFEFALWRPVAWDAAYLRVPWPTCWCAWSLEASAAHAALDVWRREVALTWPEVLGPDFDHDLDLATEAWAWLAGSWCLAGLVDGEPARSNPVKPMPRMPDRVLRFLRTAAAGRALPELAEVAARLADRVTTRYAASDVPLAPAFTGGEYR
jgi:hypothetical protein